MQVLCPTCHGRGYIPDPKYYGRPYWSTKCPEIMCRTCWGSGWVTVPDQVYSPCRPRPLWDNHRLPDNWDNQPYNPCVTAPGWSPTYYYVGDPLENPVRTVCQYESSSYTPGVSTY